MKRLINFVQTKSGTIPASIIDAVTSLFLQVRKKLHIDTISMTRSNHFTIDENEIAIIDQRNDAVGETVSSTSKVDSAGDVSIQEFPVSATCSIQSAALETLAFIRSFDKSGIFLQVYATCFNYFLLYLTM